MPYRKSPIQIDHIYHLYNRGVDKSKIFFRKSDWEYFILKMHHYFKPEYVSVLAYCLMPNHYHLLVDIHTEQFISKVIHPFFSSYVISVNKYQNRVGPLFQGPFKAKEIDSDESLLHLSRYIHLNPVEAGLVSHPNEWNYSSYLAYSGKKDEPFINSDLILSMMNGFTNYEKFVLEYSINELDRNLAID